MIFDRERELEGLKMGVGLSQVGYIVFGILSPALTLLCCVVPWGCSSCSLGLMLPMLAKRKSKAVVAALCFVLLFFALVLC
jgi:hypothetical protein